jgi:hypothetical protein
MVTKEFFYVLPAVMEQLTGLLPKQIDFLNIHIREIGFSNF